MTPEKENAPEAAKCPLRGCDPEKNPQPHVYRPNGAVPLTGAVLCMYCGHVCPCCDGVVKYHESAPQAPLDPSPAMPVLDALTLAAEWAELDADGCPFPEAKADYLSAAAALRALADALPDLPVDLESLADTLETVPAGYWGADGLEEDIKTGDVSWLRALAQVLGEAPRS